MAKMTKEQLKQFRIENLKKARSMKKTSGRPKGSKNKVTDKKLVKMLERLIEEKKP